MAKGTVKWFNDKKGYGFINEEGGRDIFVHYSSINSQGYKTLSEGDQVNFEIEEKQQRPGSEKRNKSLKHRWKRERPCLSHGAPFF